MTTNQYNRACEIQAEIKGIKSDLCAWENNARQGVVAPLQFRLGGGLEYTPKEAFEGFKLACVSGLNKRMQELLTEFGNL